jgi:hypothetical protein
MGNFIDKSALISQQAIAGTARLKLYCRDPKALEEVKKVERNNCLWNIAKLAVKIIISLSIVFAIPALSATASIGAAILTAAKIILIVKAAILSTNLISIGRAWDFSRKENIRELNNLDEVPLYIYDIYSEILAYVWWF